MKLEGITMNEQEYLSQYDSNKYVKPSVTVDINIFSIFEETCTNYRKLPEKKLKILLIRRGSHPYQGMYALPGGFVKPNETLEAAAFRELQEETGADCEYLQQLRTFSDPNRDPRYWVITCAYTALVNGTSLKISAGSDAADVKWFNIDLSKDNNKENQWILSLNNNDSLLKAIMVEKSRRKVDDLPNLELVETDNLAFDHALIIGCALLKLRENIKYEPIIFNMLPDKFTLTEAQQVYEAILGEKVYAQVFRRKIAGFVEETLEYTETGGHRPSRLYRKKQTLN